MNKYDIVYSYVIVGIKTIEANSVMEAQVEFRKSIKNTLSENEILKKLTGGVYEHNDDNMVVGLADLKKCKANKQTVVITMSEEY